MNFVKIRFVGIDSFNRPIFIDKFKNYYGAIDLLFDRDATEEHVLNKVKKEDITYFGKTFGCEPSGYECKVVFEKRN